MLVDLLIVALAISAIFRGRETGFIRQLFAMCGFVCGLFLGAWLQPHTVSTVNSPVTRSIVTLVTTLGCALLVLLLAEIAGAHIKHWAREHRFNKFDNILGSFMGVASLVVSIWLIMAIVSALPLQSLQNYIKNSRIISLIEHHLPSAPTVIANIGHLIDPNGFPDVFIGREPNPTKVKLPSLGELNSAVQADKASIVKVEGLGCGGIVEGSGFVVGAGYVATNAHVIAGIKQPYVIDGKGNHSATPVWFDPQLDFAVLRVSNLAGSPLLMSREDIANGTPGAVLGYPGGGSLNAGAAVVLDHFTAKGRDIYGTGRTVRDIYEVQAEIIPGNSGGPLVGKDGRVIGVVFAESTSYDHVGYALTANAITDAIRHAISNNRTVATGSCAE